MTRYNGEEHCPKEGAMLLCLFVELNLNFILLNQKDESYLLEQNITNWHLFNVILGINEVKYIKVYFVRGCTMKFYKFDNETGKKITIFNSNFVVSSVIIKQLYPQLFLIMAGEGYVRGEKDEYFKVQAGDAVF